MARIPTDSDQLLLGGLRLDASDTTSPSGGLETLRIDGVATTALPSEPAASAALASLALGSEKEKDGDAFGFVGAEMSKAGGGKS